MAAGRTPGPADAPLPTLAPSPPSPPPSSAAAALPADLLRAIMAAVPPGTRRAVRATAKGWADGDALDVLIPAALPPSPAAWAPFAALRGLDLRSATAPPPAALTAAVHALPSLTALALRDVPDFPLLAAVAAAAPRRLRVLRLECAADLPAGGEASARLGPAGDALTPVLDLLGACTELDVAGRRAVWGVIGALREAGVGCDRGGADEAGGAGEGGGGGGGGGEGEVDPLHLRPSPPDSPRSEAEDAWEADHGGGGIDDDEAALAAEAEALRAGGGDGGLPRDELRAARLDSGRAAAPRVRPGPPPHPVRFGTLTKVALDVAFPTTATRPPDTRAGSAPWVGDPPPPPAPPGPPPSRRGPGDEAAAAVALFNQPLGLPCLAHLSVVCPGGRQRAGLPGYDAWGAPHHPARDSPDLWAPSLAFALAAALHARHRAGARSLRSLHLAGWPLGAVGAHPRTLAVLASACPGLETLRLDGGPGVAPPDARAWDAALRLPPPAADEAVGLAGGASCASFSADRPPAFFPRLKVLVASQGLFARSASAFAAAAGAAGALPALQHVSLVGGVGGEGCAPDPGGGLGGAAAAGRLRTLRCAAAHVKACAAAMPAGCRVVDLRAEAEGDGLGPDDVARLASASPGLVAASLPLGGAGWADAGRASAALRCLAARCRGLRSLTLEVWGGEAAAAALFPALGDLLAACPVADLEVAAAMEAAWDGAAWGGDGAACSAVCSALTAALARGAHLRRVCVRRVPGGVCAGLVATLAAAAPHLSALVVVSDAPPALPPGLAAQLAARRVSLGTPRSGPPSIPSPLHHLWLPGPGGAVGTTVVASADVRGGAGRGWPAGWQPGVGPAPGAVSAGVLWWHTSPVTPRGEPGCGAAIVPGDPYSAAAAAARWWEEPGFC